MSALSYKVASCLAATSLLAATSSVAVAQPSSTPSIEQSRRFIAENLTQATMLRGEATKTLVTGDVNTVSLLASCSLVSLDAASLSVRCRWRESFHGARPNGATYQKITDTTRLFTAQLRHLNADVSLHPEPLHEVVKTPTAKIIISCLAGECVSMHASGTLSTQDTADPEITRSDSRDKPVNRIEFYVSDITMGKRLRNALASAILQGGGRVEKPAF